MADTTVDICPTINKDQVADILKNDYGFINGKIKELDGYDDKNYHITVRTYICYIRLYTVYYYLVGTR